MAVYIVSFHRTYSNVNKPLTTNVWTLVSEAANHDQQKLCVHSFLGAISPKLSHPRPSLPSCHMRPFLPSCHIRCHLRQAVTSETISAKLSHPKPSLPSCHIRANSVKQSHLGPPLSKYSITSGTIFAKLSHQRLSLSSCHIRGHRCLAVTTEAVSAQL
jgi:hypothetical protein